MHRYKKTNPLEESILIAKVNGSICGRVNLRVYRSKVFATHVNNTLSNVDTVKINVQLIYILNFRPISIKPLPF